jgi:hypothetical protein
LIRRLSSLRRTSAAMDGNPLIMDQQPAPLEGETKPFIFVASPARVWHSTIQPAGSSCAGR